MTKQAGRGSDFVDRLQTFTESLLTRRLKKRLREKMKQQKRNVIVDWLLAILWAACVVLVINQYIFQNYQIPSESMVKTLKIGDMIFVDKLSYGPELLPGVAKMPGVAKPQRGQIIVFENPTYLSKGPVFTIVQQMVYMLSLTLVDIDRDENGEQRVHYLIKRAVGFSGDRISVQRGEVLIKPEGASGWYSEAKLMQDAGLPFKAERAVAKDDYRAIEAVGLASAYQEAGLVPPVSAGSTSLQSAYKDGFGYDMKRVSVLKDINPADARIAASSRRYSLGWYIPEGRIFPMGDNRDNSRDARYFGPVNVNRVLGRALFIYWPLGRAGRIR
ncbi:MAG: signal peptidase I [Spirochaetae bacterium HGW-Spirochaetae-9]|nr:MAG: signal peptidase I [Spirochaetae bacterium HGW-Spirochaetae-9]